MRRVLRRRVVLLGVAGAVIAGAAVSITLLSGLIGVSGQEPPRDPANDAEWIQMIRDAKDYAKTPLAPPSVPAGAILTYNCADIPATANISQASLESSPDGKSGRTVFDFVDFATDPVGQHYELVVPWGGPEQKCANDNYTEGVNRERNVAAHQTAVAGQQADSCKQVALMAAGKPRSDTSLAPVAMSVEVAKEYLQVFCQ